MAGRSGKKKPMSKALRAELLARQKTIKADRASRALKDEKGLPLGLTNPAKPKWQRSNPVIINENQLVDLAALQCSIAEICSYLGIKPEQLSETHKRTIEHSREAGRVELRRAMLAAALKGSATMQIWLSKHWLGWLDAAGQGNVAINVIVRDLPTAEGEVIEASDK